MSLEQNITLDRKTIFRMLIPVLIDQLFITLLPIVNTVVVSALGQSSMSGVSIVDQINQLISFTVVAIGMGGAVMAAPTGQMAADIETHGKGQDHCRQLENPMALVTCKKDIARVKTIIREREIKANKA